MAVNDQIADMLTRIRNGANAGYREVNVPYSRLKESLARIIKKEGFIKNVEVAGSHPRKVITIELKYKPDGKPVFNDIKRVSKLGRREYVTASEIRPSRQGVGVSILSTSKGLMKDIDAKKLCVGGEVLCTIW